MTMPDRSPRALPTYESLVEQALVGVYVVQDGRIVYANPRLGELFGYRVDDLLALPSVDALIDPDERVTSMNRAGQRLTGSTPPPRYIERVADFDAWPATCARWTS